MDAARSGQRIAGREHCRPSRASSRAFLAAVIGAIALGAATVAPTAAAQSTIPVIEFLNLNDGQYFITANPAEIAALDAGGPGGRWRRTGQAFQAYRDAATTPGAVGVCRFFGTDRYRADGFRIGPNDHFYTADPAECEFVKTGYPSVAADGVSYPAYTYEGIAFAVAPPTAGSCPAGTSPVYRAVWEIYEIYDEWVWDGDFGWSDPVFGHRYGTLLSQLGPSAPFGAKFTVEGLVMCTPTPRAGGFPTSSPILGYCANCPSFRDVLSRIAPPQIVIGEGDLFVSVELANPSTDVIAATLPAGTRFVASSAAHTDGYLRSDLAVNLAPGKTRVGIYLMSSSPALQKGSRQGAAYTLDGPTTNAELLNLLAMQPTPQTWLAWPAAQHWALWEITFGRGSLTARQLELLELMRTTPATTGNNANAGLFAMLEEFQGLLSYVWYAYGYPSNVP